MVGVILVFSLYLSLIEATTKVNTQAQECPLWTVFKNDTCVCAAPLGQIVRCNPLNKDISVRIFYCMTADSEFDPVVGACLKNLSYISYMDHYEKIRSNSTTNINVETCGGFNRKGLMCGQCIKDHGFPAYTYNIACVKCLNYKFNWLKYLGVAYIPLTIFFLIIIIFGVSANSGLLVGYVTVSQMVATHSLSQVYIEIFSSLGLRNVITFIFIFFSTWNLDFFRTIERYSFCLHPNISALDVLSLDYLVAIYPMVAVVLTYIIVQKFSYVSCLSIPFNKCLHLFKKEWNIGSSLIEAFATLILLSQVKILNVTFNILTPTYLYNMNATHSHTLVYSAPHTEYLSKQHLPYFVLAIAMSFVFNFLPFLLICMYPCACVQKCLNWTGLRHPALSIFMDAFQGSYKLKPFYFRSFSAIYMIAQLTNLLIFSTLGFEYYHAAASLMLMMIISLVAIARPYRNKWHNIITLAMFSAVLIVYITFAYELNHNITIFSWDLILTLLTWVGLSVPPLYGSFLLIRKFLPDCIISEVKNILKRKFTTEYDHENTPL